MLRLYNYFQSKIQSVELTLSTKLEQRLAEPYATRLFYFGLVILNLELVVWQIVADIFKFAIILASDPGDSFNLFFKQRELRSCPYSYHTYKQIQTKIRIFSTAGVMTLVVVAVASSLITNLIFGPKKPTFAATFGWLQTSFIGGVTTTPAMHPGNQSGWSWFLSKDNGINITASGTVQLGQITGSTTQTTDADFNAGTNSSTTVANNAVTLAKDLHVNEYTVGKLANINITVTAVGAQSPWLLTLSGTPNLARIFKNDKFTDSSGKTWKVLSLNPSTTTPRLLVIDSEENGGSPVAGAGTVGRWYADLVAWETARAGDLVARNAVERALPYYDSILDTRSISWGGWTTDAEHYPEIFVSLGERHKGIRGTGYRLESGIPFGSTAMPGYLRVNGLAIKDTYNGSSGAVYISGANGAIFSNIFLYDSAGGNGFRLAGSTNVTIVNSIILNMKGDGIANDSGFCGRTANIYNVTVASSTGYGIRLSCGTMNVKNTYSGGNSSGDYTVISGTMNKTAAASSDGTGSVGSQNIAYSGVNFVDTTAGSEDLHMNFPSSLKNAGTDLSADSAYPFSVDMDGDTRTGTWDIGVDDVGATYVHVSSIGTNARDFATLQAWEDARDGTTTTRYVFKTTSQSGALVAGEVLTGDTSGATGIYIPEHATPLAIEKYVTVDRIAGNFVQGDTITGSISGKHAQINRIITASGTIEKGEIYNDSVFTAGVDLSGSTVDSSHYMWLVAEPRSRNYGIAGKGAVISIGAVASDVIISANQYTVIDGLEITNWGTNDNIDRYAIKLSSNSIAKNNIIHDPRQAISLRAVGITNSVGAFSNNQIYNNQIYNFTNANSGYGILYYRDDKVYNNVIYYVTGNNNNNIPTRFNDGNAGSTVYFKNNIVANCPAAGCIQSANGLPGEPNINYNISTDNTALGANSLAGQALSNIKFVSIDPTLVDLHILPGSVARNIGADLSSVLKTDADDQSRPAGAGTWDVGADEWQASSFVYKASGVFESDSHNLDVKANFNNLAWNPTGQNPDTKAWVEIAANNDNATWDYKPLNEFQYPAGVTVDEKLVLQDCTGYSNCYTTLNAALAAYSNKDLVAQNKIASVKIDGYWTSNDSTRASVSSSFVTDATHYIRVYTTEKARANGKWSNNKYRLVTTASGDYQDSLLIHANHVKIDGLQIKINTGGFGANAISTNLLSAGNKIEISNNIITGNNSGGGINCYGSNTRFYVWNNILYDLGGGFGGIGYDFAYLFNNIIYNVNGAALSSGTGNDVVLKNNAAFNCGSSCYINNYLGGTNNASSDNTANMYDLSGGLVGLVATNEFIDVTNRDFHLKPTSVLKNAALDLSADSDLSFGVDMENHSRPVGAGTWDIGPLEYGATSGAIPSSLSGNRYVKYKIYFDTSDISQTPILSDLTINYTSLPAQASLVSSPFNSNDAANILAKLEWVESLATSSDVTFQLRTSPDGAAWSPWLGPDGTSGTAYTDPSGSEAIPALLGDGDSDQWLQYQATLHSDGVYSPTLSAVNITYVVNGSPEIQIATSSPIYQSASGTVAVDYFVRDADTLTGKTPGTVLVGLDYCTANCLATGTEVWASASLASLSGQSATTTVEQGSWLGYSLVWNPNLDFDAQVLATSSFKVRLTANDSEAANNVGYSISNEFSLDTRDPDISSFIVNAAASSSNIHIAATDDHAMLMEVSSNADFSGATAQAFVPTSTADLAAQPANLYLRLTDEYGNVSTSSVVLPETPAAMMIQDNSNLFSDPNEYRLFIAWKVPADPVAGFDHYHIERSENNIDWAELTQASNRTINYYGDSTTVQDQEYFYRVSVIDQNGNASYLSATVSGKANGTQDAGEGGGGIGAAGVPPVISNVISTSTYSTSVTLVWETDALSDSLVYYVTASGTDFSTAPSTGVATLRNTEGNYGQHAVTLTNLVPSTTYYYIVKSAAINGAAATSTEREFTTLPGPVIADDVQVIGITNSQATISWSTDLDSSSYVLFATSSELLSPTETGSIDLTTSHLVTISNLAPGTTYYFTVKSDTARRDHADGQAGYFSFETTQDVEPPVISNVRCGHTADTTLSVLWDTNEPATGLAAYGVQPGVYASTSTENINLNLDHQFDLENLLASTTYYFIVNSKDQNGYSATSTEYSCSTAAPIKTEEEIKEMIEQAKQEGKTQGKAEQQAAQSGGGGTLIIDKTDKVAPIITNITVENIKAESAEIRWTTDEEANSFVSYATGTTTENLGNWQLQRGHAVTLNNLRASSSYAYKVASMDGSGNLSVSNELTFTTPTLEEQLKQEGKTDQEIETLIEQAKDKEEDKSRVILEAAKKAMDLVAQVANQVSLGTLEQVLTGQFDTIEQLAQVIPAPILGGEPTVVTTPTTATISWSTDREANSMVAYAPENKYLPKGGNNAYLQAIGQADDLSKSHQVKLADLKPDTTYHFQLRSKGKLGPVATSRDFTFKTRKEVLEIINYASRVEGENKVAFQWSTNLEAEAEIAYTPYRNGKLAIEERKVETNKDKETIHNIILNQLAPGTVYQIVLANIDGKKTRVEKTIEQFSTTADKTSPEFITVQTESALAQGKEQRVQTVITWTTSEPTIGQLSYQAGVNASDEILAEKFTAETTFSKKHMALITKFQPGQIYTFRIAIEDYSGNKTVSKAYTILAPRQKESVFQLILKNFEDIFGWVGKVGN